MRCLLLLVLLTACSESHNVGDFDSGPRRTDSGLGFDAPGFDSPSFDASSFDVPRRRDAGGRDAGTVGFDAGPVFDAGRDTAPPIDIREECFRLCERADMCIPNTDFGDCVGGCIDIEEFAQSPDCRLLAYNIFRCADSVPCEELETAFDGGACEGTIEEFGDSCGEL